MLYKPTRPTTFGAHVDFAALNVALDPPLADPLVLVTCLEQHYNFALVD